MKLQEVLTMGGSSTMMQPSSHISTQVVQPRTIQASDPEQSGEGYEAIKNKQKGQEEIAVEVYNDSDIDYIKDPYTDPEELAKKIKKTIFAIDNKLIADLNLGSIDFAKESHGKSQE